jgi:TPR repeat protein
MKSIAYCSLGAMYLRGLGTNQDLSLAVKFYQQAANLVNYFLLSFKNNFSHYF